MIIETKEIYKCEFCNKLYQRKDFCIKHEEICRLNPDNFRACHSCRFLVKTNDSIYIENEYCCNEINISILHCNKRHVHIHPPKVEKRNKKIEFEEIENMPMPKICESFEIFDYLSEDQFSTIDKLNFERHKNEHTTKTNNI